VVIASTGVKSSTMVHEMVMTLLLSPSWVVTRTTGPGSIRVKALLNFNWRMEVSPESPLRGESDCAVAADAKLVRQNQFVTMWEICGLEPMFY